MRASFARVAVPVPLGQAFSYSIPEEMSSALRLGSRVLVSFGARKVLGIVLRFESSVDIPEDKVKPLLALIEGEPVLEPELLSFLVELSRYYLAPIGEVMRLALPALERGVTESLKEQGMLEGLKQKRVGKLVQVVRATALEPPTALKGQAKELLEHLRQAGAWLPVSGLSEQFKSARGALKRLQALGLVELVREARVTDRYSVEITRDEPPQLTEAQREAIAAIAPSLGASEFKGWLLQGITGSGKTEVYLRLAERCLKAKLGTIVLVPEIALTPQLVGRFRARLGDEIAVLHSGLTDGERHIMWKKIRGGELKVVVGARSALFAPIRDLALIIVDEEHDASFKQEEGVRYHARDMALLRAHRARATCVLGSATPSVQTMYAVRQNRLGLLLLPTRAHKQAVLPQVEVVDLRNMGPGPTGDRLLSLPLHRALERTLDAKQQAILFLNRRGFAPSLSCAACGSVFECPNCSVALTYHRARGERLICHYCDYGVPAPRECEKCKSPELTDEGAGTERIEALLKQSFPEARVARLDRDVAAGLKSERILAAMKRGEVDILVGTQMVTKGHDLEQVTLVGVLNADAALSMPDFRAAEKTFQLLVQVAGRAGRGAQAGTVLIQTRQPNHPAIVHAMQHDVALFVERELSDREELGYPPFSHTALIRVDSANEPQARAAAQALAQLVRSQGELGLEVRGPAVSPLARLRQRYRFQILLRSAERPALRRALLAVLRTRFERTLRVSVDVDPMSML